MNSGASDRQSAEEFLSAATGLRWHLVDPFETQDKDFAGVPPTQGVYVWLRRDDPPFGAATRDALFVDVTRNLRRRLFQLSRSDVTAATDGVVQRVFEVVVAPAVQADLLQRLVQERRSSGIARMWIRDHVVFAFAEHSDAPAEREPDGADLDLDDWSSGAAQSLADLERAVANRLQPWLNRNPKWNSVGETWHEHHDITLPIQAAPPEE